MRITKIQFVNPLEEENPDDGDLDMIIELEDGRSFSLLVATPSRVYWWMNNERIDYFFGFPPVFVPRLTADNIEKALDALVNEDNGKWLSVYGAKQV